LRRNFRNTIHGVFCTMIDTVDEKPCWSFEKPAPIHTTTMKIFAATIMSTKFENSAKHSRVGTYCSARDDRKMILSRSAMSRIRQQYTSTAHCGSIPALPSGMPSTGSPERKSIMTSQNTMSL
jgi:hypothetical protein